MNPNDEKNLEQFIHKSLRSLPERRAPRSLEHRVLAALASRQALPWWHQSLAHWPLPARLAFFALCGLALVSLFVVSPLGAEMTSAKVQETASALSPFHSLAETLAASGRLLLSSIPSTYLYGTLGVIGAAYLALIGVGATAYRTLVSHR